MGSIFAVGFSRRALGVGAGTLALVLIAMLRIASSAQAAELLYWDNYGANPDNVAFANIDGTGGGLVNLGSAELESPEGMAYDTLTNRLFVASEAGPTGQILAIDLGGTGASPFTAPGAPIEEPEGIAVDPTTETIYWANDTGKGSIAWAKLDGSAGGVLNTTGATVNVPCCRIAVDPAGGRVYWVNEGGVISYANLNNTGGGGTLNLSGTTVTPGGEGIAVDDAVGRVYFLGEGKTGYANVNGTGGGDIPTTGGIFSKATWGLAFDPSVGRLYWGNEGNGKEASNAIGFVNLGGGGGGISIATAPVANPQDPVIIKSPTSTERPKLQRRVLRGKHPRSKLSCSTGGWAVDYPGSFVYQSPRSYALQWKRNGMVLKGAKATRIVRTPGKYVCAVTATNQAGVATAASNPVKVKKPHRKHRHR